MPCVSKKFGGKSKKNLITAKIYRVRRGRQIWKVQVMQTINKTEETKDLFIEAFSSQEAISMQHCLVAINLLMLTPILYMLLVYDRVVSSGSMETLTMLTILMTAL